MTRTAYRSGITAGMPAALRKRPIDHRGYPVPWFVTEKDNQGLWEFRGVTMQHLKKAIQQRRCWVCGEKLGQIVAFVAGPMCGVNRTSAEPPVHRACGIYAVKKCPFMLLPGASRREAGIKKNNGAGGLMIERNPGVSMIWLTKRWEVVKVPNGILHRFARAKPVDVLWYREGREATHVEVMESIASGLPRLREMANTKSASAALDEAIEDLVSNYTPAAA